MLMLSKLQAWYDGQILWHLFQYIIWQSPPEKSLATLKSAHLSRDVPFLKKWKKKKVVLKNDPQKWRSLSGNYNKEKKYLIFGKPNGNLIKNHSKSNLWDTEFLLLWFGMQAQMGHRWDRTNNWEKNQINLTILVTVFKWGVVEKWLWFHEIRLKSDKFIPKCICKVITFT